MPCSPAGARRQGVDNWLGAARRRALSRRRGAPRRLRLGAPRLLPDPWPKLRHHKRRLFVPRDGLDLVFRLLRRGGSFSFATDFLDYGETVVEILAGYPALRFARREGPWDEGRAPTTRPSTSARGARSSASKAWLEVDGGEAPLHPQGRNAVLAATWVDPD